MSVEDDVRSLDARVAKLTAAVEKSATAQIESAEWCSELLSDMASLMADVRELRRAVAVIAKAQSVVVAASEVSASYPIAAGYHDGQIAAMASRGCTDREIGESLGVSQQTVGRRRRALGIECNHPAPPWTKAEDDALREAMAGASRYEEVARMVPGRSAHACRRRAYQIGLRLRDPAHAAWCDAADAALSEMWERGDAVDAICSALGRNRGAVRSRAYKLGLTRSKKRFEATKGRAQREFWARRAS